MKSASRQEGRIVWNGILSLSKEQLASLISLLEKTTFFNVLANKSKALVNKEDKFAQDLKQRSQELSKMEQPALILRLVGELEKLAEVAPGHLAERRDFEDLCSELAERAIISKRDSSIDFSGTTLNDLISFVMQEMLNGMQEMLNGVEKNYGKLGAAEQREIVEQLLEHLQSLPDDQQKLFLENAGIDDLTEKTIQQALITGTIGIGFSAMVSVVGFAFYTTAASMLASLAGLIGLTLPFAAYIGLSSFLFVLASPITVPVLLAGLITAAWWKGDQKIQQNLLPMAIVQIASPTAAELSPHRAAIEADVFESWHGAINGYLELDNKTTTLIAMRHSNQDKRIQLNETSKKIQGKLKRLDSEINASCNKVCNLALVNADLIANGQWGEAYKAIGIKILNAQAKQKESVPTPNEENFVEQISESVSQIWGGLKADFESKKAVGDLKSALKSDPKRVVYSKDEELRDLFADIHLKKNNKSQLELPLASLELQIKDCDKNLAGIAEDIDSLKTKMQGLEEEYFGIKKAAHDYPELPNSAHAFSASDAELAFALNQPLVPQTEEEQLRSLLFNGRGDSVFAGLVVGDFLYDYLRIDPLVMEGIDFARAADLSNPLSFAAFANEQAAAMMNGGGDSIARLKGYVAERMVAQHMAAAGHDVSFPEASNQAGYDLLIDGQPFQVKCTESPAHIHEHLEKYPDIPVIVNAEHAEDFAGTSGVYVDPGLSVTDITALTEQGIAQGAGLLDFELPWIALAVSTAVEIRELYHSRTGLTNSVINIATDTAGRTVLGSVGAMAGGVACAVIFGPAGLVVGSLGGAIGGGIGGGMLAKLGREFFICKESESARNATRLLAEAAADTIPEKLNSWNNKQLQLRSLVIGDRERNKDVGKIIEWLLQETEKDVQYFEQRQRELRNIAAGTDEIHPNELAKSVLDLIGRAGIHPHRLQNELKRMFIALKELTIVSAKYRI